MRRRHAKNIHLLPPAGDMERNLENARKYAEYVMKRCGAIPLAPHLYFTQFLNDASPRERELGIRAGLELLDLCDELFAFGNQVTEGMEREIRHARSRGIPVRYIGAPEMTMTSQMGGM